MRIVLFALVALALLLAALTVFSPEILVLEGQQSTLELSMAKGSATTCEPARTETPVGRAKDLKLYRRPPRSAGTP